MARFEKKGKLAPSGDVVKKNQAKLPSLKAGGQNKSKGSKASADKNKLQRKMNRDSKLDNDLSSILKELRVEGGKDTENFGVSTKQTPKITEKAKKVNHKSPAGTKSAVAERVDKKKKFQGPKETFKRKKRKVFPSEKEDDDDDDFDGFEDASPKKRQNSFAPANKKKKFNDFEEIGGNDVAADDVEEAEHWDSEATLSSDPRFAGMIFKPGTGAKWFTQCPILGDLTTWPDLTPKDLAPLRAEADEILAEDARLYKIYLHKRPEKKDFRWVDTVMKGGTVADKMAAFVVLVQDSPIHNYDRITRMISLAGSKSRREALMGIDTLREVFLSDLLAENRKLRAFKDQPLSKLDSVIERNLRTKDGKKLDRVTARRRILGIWRFEDLTKEAFSKFVGSVIALSSDAVETTRFRTLHTIYSSLLNNPEQEKRLLEVLVNKLGDPSKKVAASTAHRLSMLLTHHPNMKLVVTEDVEHFVFRPNVGDRAQYYAVCFLSQVLLSDEDNKVAVKLIIIYLSLFKAHLAKMDFNRKIITALLSGIRRAFPYAKETLKREADTAKAAAQNGTDAGHDGSSDSKAGGAVKKKASRIPTPGARLLSELDGLFKAVYSATSFSVSVRALTVLELIAECHGEYADRFYRSLYRKMVDPTLADSSAVSLFLSLLFRAISNDPSDDRRLAFVKRILQLCHTVPTALSCGLLMIASKLLEKNPEFLDPSRAVTASKLAALDDVRPGDAEEEEERYVDADMDVQFNVDADVKSESAAATGSWVHSGNRPTKPGPSKSASHDMRNPDRFGSSASVAWEVERLRNHYHPTLRLFAVQIGARQKVQYDGDPLRDFALGHFLDRFVQRNPKQIDSQKVPEIKKKGNWEPTETDVVFGSRRVIFRPGNVQDEDFIKKFASLKKTDKKLPKEEKEAGSDEDDDDIESVSDAEFDAFLASARDDADVDSDDGDLDLGEEEDPDLDLSDDDLDDVDFAGGVGTFGSSRGAADDEDEDDDEDGEGDLFGDSSGDEGQGSDLDESGEGDDDEDDVSGGDDFEPIDSDGLEEEEELEED